jgi:hypothetical protein
MKLQTQESRPRFRTTDALLSAETTAHNAAMMGRTWVGNIRSRLEALSATDRSIALDELQRGLAAYGQSMHSGTMRPNNFGSLGTGGIERAEQVFDVGSGAEPDDINAANKAFWADGANRSAARVLPQPRDREAGLIASMQRANDAFWQQATAHQKSPERQWGKG